MSPRSLLPGNTRPQYINISWLKFVQKMRTHVKSRTPFSVSRIHQCSMKLQLRGPLIVSRDIRSIQKKPIGIAAYYY